MNLDWEEDILFILHFKMPDKTFFQMNKILFAAFLLIGCTQNQSAKKIQCDDSEFAKVDFYPEEKLSISLPKNWKVVDTTIWSFSDLCFYWRVFSPVDSSGVATLELLNIKGKPFGRDIESLKKRLHKYEEIIDNSGNSSSNINEFYHDGWIIVTENKISPKNKRKHIGQIIALKNYTQFEFFIESNNSKDVDCSISSFSKLNH